MSPATPSSLWMNSLFCRALRSDLTAGPPSRETSRVAASSRSAFTLLELLLAVAIFAVVLLAIHTVFYSALSLRNRTTRQIEASIPVQHALQILQRDLANLVPPGGTFSGPFQSPGVAGGQGSSSANSSNVYSAVLPGRVVSPELYTTTGLLSDLAPWGEIARVTYYLASPTNNTPGFTLMRAVAHNLLPVVEDQPEHQILLEGVTDLSFQYFDGYQWIDYWDSTTTATPLPAALKVQLQLADPDVDEIQQQRAPIELIVALQAQATATTDAGAEADESGGGS